MRIHMQEARWAFCGYVLGLQYLSERSEYDLPPQTAARLQAKNYATISHLSGVLIMNYPPRKAVLITAPATEPLTLSEVKLFLRIDGTTEDALLASLITTARQLAEKDLRNVLITQSWQLRQVYVPGQPIHLIPGPVQTITQVTSVYNNEQTILSADDYKLDVTERLLSFTHSFSSDSIQIDFTAGYGNAAAVPEPIKQGILQVISEFYHHREAGDELPRKARMLWRTYREVQL